MRIAHVVSTFTSRETSLLQDAMERIQERGLSPELLTLHAPQASRSVYEAPPWRPDGFVERWLDVSMGRKWHGSSRTRERAVERSLRAARPDIIHAHHGPNAVLVADIALQMDVPLVVSLYTQDLEQMRTTVWSRRYSKMWSRAAAVVVPSEYARRAVVGAGAPPDRVHVCPVGVDLSELPYTPRETPLQRFLCVGTCVPRNGFDDVLRAVSQVSGKTFLKILGDGPLMPRLGVQARRLGVSVQFAPILSRRTIQDALQGADILLHADRTVDASSGVLPRVILQAHALGVPCIATRHAAAPEAFPEDTWLVPERASRQMAQKIEALRALDADELAMVTAKNRDHIEQVFDVERGVDAVVALYASLG